MFCGKATQLMVFLNVLGVQIRNLGILSLIAYLGRNLGKYVHRYLLYFKTPHVPEKMTNISNVYLKYTNDLALMTLTNKNVPFLCTKR